MDKAYSNTELSALVAQRPPPERAAIWLVTQMIVQYGGREGVGLFTGLARYRVLQARLEQAAISARDLPDLWSRTCRLMLWPIGPRSADAPILHVFATEPPAPVLAALRTSLAAILMIARAVAAEDRAARAALSRALSPELAEVEAEALTAPAEPDIALDDAIPFGADQ